MSVSFPPSILPPNPPPNKDSGGGIFLGVLRTRVGPWGCAERSRDLEDIPFCCTHLATEMLAEIPELDYSQSGYGDSDESGHSKR